MTTVQSRDCDIQPNALVVDDSKIARHVLSEQLHYLGFSVEVAISAEDALQQIREKSQPDHFSVIFMDYLLPGMDGLEAVSRLRAMTADGSISVIMYTSEQGERFRERARAAGANAIFLKSDGRRKLRGILDRLARLPQTAPAVIEDNVIPIRPQPQAEQALATTIHSTDELPPTEQDIAHQAQLAAQQQAQLAARQQAQLAARQAAEQANQHAELANDMANVIETLSTKLDSYHSAMRRDLLSEFTIIEGRIEKLREEIFDKLHDRMLEKVSELTNLGIGGVTPSSQRLFEKLNEIDERNDQEPSGWQIPAVIGMSLVAVLSIAIYVLN